MYSFVDIEENSQDKEKAKSKIENNKNDLTKQQYNVLIGLVNSGDTNGAIKGMYKILRRNKAHF